MKKAILAGFAAAILGVLAVPSASAHHSFAAEYDGTKAITIKEKLPSSTG